MSSNGFLMGLGNPLLDMMTVVNDTNLLNKYDIKTANAYIVEDKNKEVLLPLYDELVNNHQIEYVAGGATQNTIRVCQWFLPENSTSFIGCVGNDQFGNILANQAKKDGVNAMYYIDENTPTGTCAVIVHEKERCLVANLAAANNYDHKHLETDDVQIAIKQAQLFYIGGFFLTVSPQAIEYIGKHAYDHSKIFAMNLSAPFISQFFKDRLNNALPYVNYIFGNETEIDAFGQNFGFNDITDRKELALKLSTYNLLDNTKARTVIITQGANYTIVVTPDGNISTYDTPIVANEIIVDTNGAGDSFVGGFLYGLYSNKTIEECVALGNYAASQIIIVSGTKIPSNKPLLN